MSTVFRYNLSIISTTDCCTLLLTCLEKAFHVGSATFTTENFKCMVRLKKFSLKKIKIKKQYLDSSSLPLNASLARYP